MAGFNFSITRGDTLPLTLTVTQNGAVYNLTGCSIRMTAKRNLDDPDASAVFTLTVGSGITITNAAGGIATITISPSNTSSLPLGYTHTLFYDVRVTNGSSVFTVIAGQLLVKPEVSVTTP